MWEFNQARKYAIYVVTSHRQVIPSATLVRLATTYDVKGWLFPAYVELCMRRDALVMDDAEELGLPVFATLTGVREAFRVSNEPLTFTLGRCSEHWTADCTHAGHDQWKPALRAKIESSLRGNKILYDPYPVTAHA